MHEPVIRAKNILPVCTGKQKMFRLLFKQVDQDDMIGIFRKLPDGIAADIRSLWIIKGGNLMGNIMNPERRVDLQKLSFDRSGYIILQAEIGSKGNERHLFRFKIVYPY